MEFVEQRFSDKEGNHLLVALYFCDDDYKRTSLYIPDEYSDIFKPNNNHIFSLWF